MAKPAKKKTPKKPVKKAKPNNKVKLTCRNSECGKSLTVKAKEKDDYSFCAKCGGPLLEEQKGGYKVKCSCGKVTKVKKAEVNDVKFCAGCGSPLYDDVAPVIRDQPAQPAAAPIQPDRPRVKLRKSDQPQNPGFPEKFWKKFKKPEYADELDVYFMVKDFIFGQGNYAQITHGVAEISAAIKSATKDKIFTLERIAHYLTGGDTLPSGVQARQNDTAQLAVPPNNQPQVVYGYHDPAYRGAISVR